MAENLNYEAKDSKCYEGEPGNCEQISRRNICRQEVSWWAIQTVAWKIFCWGRRSCFRISILPQCPNLHSPLPQQKIANEIYFRIISLPTLRFQNFLSLYVKTRNFFHHKSLFKQFRL
jgi:hypothetical protein